MVYIATIHYKNKQWIKVQYEHILSHVPEPFEIHTLLIDCERPPVYKHMHIYGEDQGSHAQNLNTLASKICLRSLSMNDTILFLDGDAFPIKDLSSLMQKVLQENRPAAVQRLENNGDRQPHPCFAIFTIGQWKKLEGDWSEGYGWKDDQGDIVTDVGGEMLRKLKEQNVDWIRLKRSNKQNLHPLLFGVYGDIVYHHGAGFRPNDGGRISKILNNHKAISKRLDSRMIDKLTPRRYRRKMRKSWIHPSGRLYRKLLKENSELSQKVHQSIVEDPNYVYTFIN